MENDLEKLPIVLSEVFEHITFTLFVGMLVDKWAIKIYCTL